MSDFGEAKSEREGEGTTQRAPLCNSWIELDCIGLDWMSMKPTLPGGCGILSLVVFTTVCAGVSITVFLAMAAMLGHLGGP